jgi:hypothetical protein
MLSSSALCTYNNNNNNNKNNNLLTASGLSPGGSGCMYVVSWNICCVIQGVPGGKDLISGECSLGQTIPI